MSANSSYFDLNFSLVRLVFFLSVSATLAQPFDEWHDILELKLEGKGWLDTDAAYDRLPARAREKVTKAVWHLSHCSAGMCVRFVTNAPTIKARWKLRNENLALPHMPATGVSGLDLYVKRENGTWHWLGAGRPAEFPENSKTLVSNISPEKREYLLYLPLYNGVARVEIGIPPEFQLSPAPERVPSKQRPIVFYGTSITQGACASRPGMAATAIVGRKLGYPVINLGFSGNGKMEPEMAELLGELDPALYVLDCVPNMNDSLIQARTEKFIKILRTARPETPILLSEGVNYSSAFLENSLRRRNESSQAAMREVYTKLIAAGYQNIYFMYAPNQFGEDGEGTVDGIHATDLGFFRQAAAFITLIKAILPDVT